jgi:hypothetical protein
MMLYFSYFLYFSVEIEITYHTCGDMTTYSTFMCVLGHQFVV